MKTAASPTKVAIVIPVFNRRETTLQGLRSLSRIDAEGFDVRIYVVDDASTDGTAGAIKADFPEVKLIEGSGELHYAAGTNRGIEAALKWSPDFIVMMNDDAVFHRSFLQRLVATAVENPRSVVGSLLLLWDEPHRIFQVAPRWSTFAGGWVIPDDLTPANTSDEVFEVESIVGNCVMFPREAVDECGLMDEKRFPYGWGDAQYVARMRRAGWQLLIDPESKVWCEPNTYPRPLHELGMSAAMKILLFNERHPVNLKRQFVARWESAPSKTKAAAAFGVHTASMLLLALKYLFARSGSRTKPETV